MKSIIFVTGNKIKVDEAKRSCSLFEITIIQEKLDIDEIQSTNPKKVSEHKANQAFLIVKKPLVVADSFWKIQALNGFPGAYMKDVAGWFDSSDFLNLMKGKLNRDISFTESITYKDLNRTKIFSKEYEGKIVSKPRGTGNSIENIAEFDGFTLGERRSQGGFSHKPKEYIWYEFAKWYSKN